MVEGPLKLPLEIEDIKAILPHRYPFLLVDRILEFEEDRRIVGLKNVTSNERYFIAGPGGVPILPASILTEAMAQVGAVLILAKPENRSRHAHASGGDPAGRLFSRADPEFREGPGQGDAALGRRAALQALAPSPRANVIWPSHATFPSTRPTPRRVPILLRSRITVASKSTWSPATTGRRYRTRSMPMK